LQTFSRNRWKQKQKNLRRRGRIWEDSDSVEKIDGDEEKKVRHTLTLIIYNTCRTHCIHSHSSTKHAWHIVHMYSLSFSTTHAGHIVLLHQKLTHYLNNLPTYHRFYWQLTKFSLIKLLCAIFPQIITVIAGRFLESISTTFANVFWTLGSRCGSAVKWWKWESKWNWEDTGSLPTPGNL
jgi:hypothetical protein